MTTMRQGRPGGSPARPRHSSSSDKSPKPPGASLSLAESPKQPHCGWETQNSASPKLLRS